MRSKTGRIPLPYPNSLYSSALQAILPLPPLRASLLFGFTTSHRENPDTFGDLWQTIECGIGFQPSISLSSPCGLSLPSSSVAFHPFFDSSFLL